MPTVTAKCSTIFIATEDETRVYRSITDIPLELRRRLSSTTRGMNSATILIADKRGREELVRALQGRPSEIQCRLVDTLRARQKHTNNRENTGWRLGSLRHWLELLLPVAVGASLWFLIDSHF